MKFENDTFREAYVMTNERFNHPQYLVKKRFLQLVGATFHIFDPAGNLAFYSKMKAFKLKEDIRLYTGEDMRTELLSIKARQIIDFAATYDVNDSQTGEKVGALRRKGFKSVLVDEWVFLNQNDQEIGLIKEDSVPLALIRRFLMNLIPQTYQGTVAGNHVCTFKQNLNPFTMKITLDFSPEYQNRLDRRLGIAAAILLCAIEGKQD